MDDAEDQNGREGGVAMQFRIDPRPYYIHGGVDIRIVFPFSDGKIAAVPNGDGSHIHTPAYVSHLEMRVERVTDGTEEIPVALRLRGDEAQQLCDALWEAGVRPTNGAGSVGQLAAVQAHLEDMRTLVLGNAHALPPQRSGGRQEQVVGTEGT